MKLTKTLFGFIVIFLVGVAVGMVVSFPIGVDYPYDNPRELGKVDKFCRSLELSDFAYDCSEWRDINKELGSNLKSPFQVKCDFQSKKGYWANGDDYNCGIDFLPEAEGYGATYNKCNSDSLMKAVDYCVAMLPEGIRDIRVILPVEDD